MKPKVAISLHGIRTRGEWQKNLVPILARHQFIPYVLDYGHFSALSLLFEENLSRKVDWLVGQYDRIREETGCQRPSVIAHSYGTSQVVRLLQKYDHVLLDKVVLAASIAPRDTDWASLLESRRVNWVESDYGGKDLWPLVASRVVPHAGASGTKGFHASHRALHQVHYPFHRHSDYFSVGHWAHNWVPTLTMHKRRVVDAMESLVYELAARNSLAADRLRAFVFVKLPASNHLRVVPGLTLGSLARGEELITVSLDPEGIEPFGAAAAFQSGKANFADVQDYWRLAMRKCQGIGVHADLKWTAAFPLPSLSVPADTAAAASAHDKCSGVLVVDGLEWPGRSLRDALPPAANMGLAGRVNFPETLAEVLLDISRALHGRESFELNHPKDVKDSRS